MSTHADPLPQALVLTAIVIGFAMTALLLAIALRARAETGSDHVDGESPPERYRATTAPGDAGAQGALGPTKDPHG